jgi:DNA-binding CsgD family transcriptional regulator
MLATALELMESIARAHARALNLIQHAARLQQAGDLASECGAWPPDPRHPHRAQPASGGAAARPGRARTVGVTGLSPQERRVLGLMSRGLTNRSIARELELSEQTIKNYLSTAFRKLGVTSRTEAAFRFLQSGVAPPVPPQPHPGDPDAPVPPGHGSRSADDAPMAQETDDGLTAVPADASVHAGHDTQERP